MKRLIDFSSRFRILKGGKISLVVSAFLGGSILANAAPSVGTVTSGTANIVQNGTVTNINQASNKAAINWQDFSISSNEVVNFNQPSSSSITLNRVIGNEKSVIDGALNANGQVWLLNSNGILFNKNASINTAGFLATTAELSDEDFNAGNYNFKNSSSNSVINLGTIEVSNNGSIILASNEVKNDGIIKAVKGKVHLVGASEYTVNLNGNSLVNLTVDKGVLDALVENSGTIIADGGEIYLTTNAVNELLKGVVNNTGVVEANSIDDLFGKVEVFAHGGTANVSGTLEAKDGFIETSGKVLSVKEGTVINTKNWLLDPTDVTIDSSSGAVGTATVGASVIETALNATGPVTVTIQADNDITVNENISWGDNTLFLDAGNDININAVLDATDGNSGSGDISLKYSNNLTMQRDDSTNSFTGKINLDSSSVVKISSDGTAIDGGGADDYTVINSLGAHGSTTTTDLKGIDGDLIGNYVLGSDIDVSASNSWGPSGFDPIGAYNASPFTGKLDGLGHTIDNYVFNNASNSFAGLFAMTDGATIQNIGIPNINIDSGGSSGGLIGYAIGGLTLKNTFVTGNIDTSNKSYIGGLVGRIYDGNGVTIDNSYFNGNINNFVTIYSGNTHTGGLVGGIDGTNTNVNITNSYSKGQLYGYEQIGGLIGSFNGQNSDSTNRIENSYSTMNVTSKGTAGGLVGSMSYIFIDNSYATGDVLNYTGTNNGNLGGLVGSVNYTYGGISNSYATGNVYTSFNDTSAFAGGLVGANSVAISSSYATGDVESYGYAAGGLAGYSTGDIDSSYATGKVFVTSSASPYNYAGGLVGRLDGSGISNSYYNYTGNLWLQGKTVGGLVGAIQNSGTITNSYSAIKSLVGYTTKKGLVGNTAGAGAITDSYFDNTILTGMSDDTTYGKSTTFLQTKANFSGAGWNIAGLDSGAYPILTFGGATIWEIDATLLNYTLSNIISGYIYKGSDYLLTDLWSTANIFDGTDYDAWTLGTDYAFSYSGGLVTGFTNANTYNNISINVLKSGYALASTGNTEGSFKIDQKDLTISGLTAANKIYDGTTAASIVDTGLNLSGLVSGDNFIVASTGVFDDKDVAAGKTVTLTNTITGTDKDNYNITDQTSTTASITPKELTISGLTSANKVYDGATTATVAGTAVLQADIATGTGNDVDGKWYTGDDVSLTGTAEGTFNDKDVADATSVSFSGLSLTGDQSGNYLLANHATAAHTISKADATVTASSDTLTYNGLTQYGSFSASGLVNGENKSVLSGISVSGGLNPGTYPAIASGSNSNYNLTFVDGVLTITEKKVNKNIENIITPIVNNIVFPRPRLIQVRTGNINLNANANTQVKTTSQPVIGRQTKAVTLTQLKNEQNKEDNNANNDVVVPVGDNSLISLVNGGVNLPDGVDQQFYVVANEDQKN